jgi:aminopeptidase
MVKNLPTMIHIISDDPDGMKGVNQSKIAKVRMRTYPKIKPFRDAMEDKYKWVIAAVPGRAWAKKVFPSLGEDEAVEALWNAILKTTRVDNGDPVENWKNHNNFLFAQRAKLNDLNLDKLVYKSNNGTDFEVSLIEDSDTSGTSPKYGFFGVKTNGAIYNGYRIGIVNDESLKTLKEMKFDASGKSTTQFSI